jgi:hypothetical protein
MKNMVIAISLLVSAAGMMGMEKGGDWGGSGDLSRMGRVTLGTASPDLFTAIPGIDKISVFGKAGNTIKYDTISLRYTPKESDFVGLDLLKEAQKTQRDLEDLFANCSPNAFRFKNDVVKGIGTGKVWVDVTMAVHAVPNPVRYLNERGFEEEVAGITYVACILHYISTGNKEAVSKALSLLKKGKCTALVCTLKLLLEEKEYKWLLNLQVSWLDGVTSTISDVTAKYAQKIQQRTKIFVGQIAGGASPLAAKAKHAAMNGFQRFNRSFTKAVGAWGGVAIGVPLGMLIAYLYNRNK